MIYFYCPAKEFGPSWKIYSPDSKNKSKFINIIGNIQISDSDVLFLDNKDKFELRLIDSNTYFNLTDESAELKISSKIKNENGNILTPLELSIKSRENFEKYTVHVRASDMNPSVFAPKQGRFSFLSEVITPID